MIANVGEAVCVLADAVFLHPISFAYPEAHSTFDVDPVAGAATRKRLLGRLAEERMRVLSYHAPWPGLGHVGRAGGAFRYVPEAAAPNP